LRKGCICSVLRGSGRGAGRLRRDHSIIRGEDGLSPIAVAGLFALAMIPLLLTPVLPLIDFTNHLARFFVLSRIGSSDFLQAHYLAHWTLLPNIGADLLAVPLLYVLPPLIAGHAIVIIVLAILYGGVLYFRHALTGQGSLLVALLLLPLLYSYVLNWGFINFLLGLGLSFWAAGWWLRYRNRPALALPLSCVWALLIFFSHGIAFVLYGLLLILLEIARVFRRREDGEAPRRADDLVRALALLALQTVLPAALFLMWWAGIAGGTAVDVLPASQEPFPAWLARAAFNHLEAILRVEEGPSLWFDIATLMFQAGLIGFLMLRGRVWLARQAWLAAGAFLLLALIPIPPVFGMAFIADRLPLFAGLVVIGALCVRPGAWAGVERLAFGVLIVTVFVRLAATAVSWHGYGALYREYVSVASQIAPRKMTVPVMVGAGNHETKIPRTEMFGPLLIIQREQAGPLFADPHQQPLLLNGPLKAAMDDLASRPGGRSGIFLDPYRYVMAASASGFDYMLISNAQLLTRPLPPELPVVARTPHFVLLSAPGTKP